ARGEVRDGGQQFAGRARGADFLDGVRDAFRGTAVDHDAGPFTRESGCDRQPDAGGRTAHQRPFAPQLQIHGRALPPWRLRRGLDRFQFLDLLAQFQQRGVLDLPDPFARHAELLPNLLERPFIVSVQAEAVTQDLRLTRLQRRHQFAQHGRVSLLFQVLVGRVRRLVLHHVGDAAGLVVAQGRFEGRGPMAAVRNCATFCALKPNSSPSSSSVGSRPSTSWSFTAAWRMWNSLSTTWTGRRMVFDWFASARLMACLIHHALYVESLAPLAGSNRSTAFIRPMLPSLIRSSRGMP